jgi:lipopolysaccharide export system ATP-binding protein
MLNEQPPILQLRAFNLCKSYRGHDVVTDVSLELRRGEAVALLGPNGAGKSTLLSMIIGIVKPDSGSIEIDGLDVSDLPIHARARLGLSYLPQETSVFRGLSVENNILLYLETFVSDKHERRRRLDALLEEFGLTAIRKTSAARLSGGQKRRCEIARALAVVPNYVMLDEPFAGVDPLAISEVRETIRRMRQRGMGVLISDHNVRETLSIVDYAYIVESGRLLAQGRPGDIVVDEEVRHFYLGNSLDN